MSAPLTVSKDELWAADEYNSSAIDQYWTDKGYTAEVVDKHNKLLLVGTLVNVLGGIGLYIAAWATRRKISLLKLLGEKPMNKWQRFCFDFKLGQTPAINFVSSCLVTNDRVFITLRIILALWSLVVTILTFAGNRSIVFGLYYPLATIITIYVSRHRHLIVEGFGSKMQFLNKFLSLLFAWQTPFRVFMAIMWWTKWFGICRYRDMWKPMDLQRAVLFQSEFCPMLFLLTEMLWFDTSFDLKSCIHSAPFITFLTGMMLKRALDGEGTVEPGQLIHFKEAPAASIPQYWIGLYLPSLSGIILVIFYRTKMFIFSKINVIKERLDIRTKCIQIFKKRQILNKFLTKQMLEGRKSSMRSTYSTIGRKSQNRQTTLRKTQMRQN